MASQDIEDNLNRAFTAKGSYALSAEQLLLCLNQIEKNGCYVQSVEAFQIVERGVNHPLRLDYSILGLSHDEDEVSPSGKKRHNEIAKQKAAQAIGNNIEMEFIFWLDDIA